MKKIIFISCMFCCILQMPAQVYDLSTGIDQNLNLITLNTPDDNWTICMPGSNPNIPSSYVPVDCGSGVISGSGPYGGHWNSIRWLSPDVNVFGEHNISLPGYFYYKYTFTTGPCDITSAIIQFDHIGSDNLMDQVIVNGNIHNVSYTFNPFTNNTSITLANSEILLNQTNEIIVRVYNEPNSPTGMEISGNLTIQTIGPPDASFCPSFIGTQLNVGSSVPGNHAWQIWGSNTGNQGSYTYVGTYNSAELGVNANKNCYFIKHTVTNNCGTDCKSMSVCNADCDWQPCNLSEPINLNYDIGSQQFTWNPVPGAHHYVIEIILNDPACCGDPNEPMLASNHRSITTYTNSYTLNYAVDIGNVIFQCFSWRVLAVCENGASMESDWECVITGPDEGRHSPTTLEENSLVSVFPNPTKGVVSIDIRTMHDGDASVEIFDLNGKLVKAFTGIKISNGHHIISWNTEIISKGTYIVKVITSNNEVINKKLIIE